jgi:hypothetical protein
LRDNRRISAQQPQEVVKEVSTASAAAALVESNVQGAQQPQEQQLQTQQLPAQQSQQQLQQTLLPMSLLTTTLAYVILTLIGSPTPMPLFSSVRRSSLVTFTSFVIVALLQF